MSDPVPVVVPEGWELKPIACQGCGAPSTEDCRWAPDKTCMREFCDKVTRSAWARPAVAVTAPAQTQDSDHSPAWWRSTSTDIRATRRLIDANEMIKRGDAPEWLGTGADLEAQWILSLKFFIAITRQRGMELVDHGLIGDADTAAADLQGLIELRRRRLEAQSAGTEVRS